MEVDAMTKCKGWYMKALNASERRDVNDFLNYTLIIYNGTSLNAPDDLLKLTEDDADVSKDEKQKIMVKTLLTLQNQLKTRKYL